MAEILAVKKRFLPFGATYDDVWEALHDHSEFVERTPALESDETYLQICSYVVILAGLTSPYPLAYQRSKKVGDERLKGKLSVGFGGHIERCDADSNKGSLSETLHNGAVRELQEELSLTVSSDKLMPFGMIYTPEDPVGRAHLGMVSTMIWDRPLEKEPARVLGTSEEVSIQGWQQLYGYSLGVYEAWSQAVMNVLRSEATGGTRLWLPAQ